MSFGTAIHESIDHIYFLKPAWDQTQDPQFFNQVVEVLKEKFKLHHVDIPNLTPLEQANKYNEMLVDGIEMLKQFWDQKEILWTAGVRPVRMELPLKLDVFHPQTKETLCVPVSCRLDGETEDSDVVEFKTSSAKYDIFETLGSNQARLYAWVQFCRTGKIPNVHYVVLLKKRKNDKIQHLHLEYDEADLLAFDAKVRAMLEKIRNREFDRPVRGHDYFCDCTKIEALLSNTQ